VQSRFGDYAGLTIVVRPRILVHIRRKRHVACEAVVQRLQLDPVREMGRLS
jgi:hypothetical protein